jgi:hypothetical protein
MEFEEKNEEFEGKMTRRKNTGNFLLGPRYIYIQFLKINIKLQIFCVIHFNKTIFINSIFFKKRRCHHFVIKHQCPIYELEKRV